MTEQESTPITLDPNCSIGTMGLYPSINYGGTPICFNGYGTLVLPKSFDTRSYVTGFQRGCFRSHPWDYKFEAIENDPSAPNVVVFAHSVTIWDSLGPPDAGQQVCTL